MVPLANIRARANTAIFSIVDAVLLQPLAFRDPDRLVRILDNAPGLALRNIGMSVPELRSRGVPQRGARAAQAVGGGRIAPARPW